MYLYICTNKTYIDYPVGGNDSDLKKKIDFKKELQSTVPKKAKKLIK